MCVCVCVCVRVCVYVLACVGCVRISGIAYVCVAVLVYLSCVSVPYSRKRSRVKSFVNQGDTKISLKKNFRGCLDLA